MQSPMSAHKKHEPDSFVDPEKAPAGTSALEPARQKSSPWCARITWLSFHAVGLLLLWLAGCWPVVSSVPFTTLITLVAVLYVTVSCTDPGFLPGGEQLTHLSSASCASCSSSTGLNQTPLLALPQCSHCGAHQMARAKVWQATCMPGRPPCTTLPHPFTII